MRTIATLLLLVLSCLIASCGKAPAIKPPEPQGALECEQQGYPCSWAEVSLDIIERSLILGGEMTAMIEGGVSNAEAVAWLNTQESVAEVQFDEHTVRFRLASGRAVWLVQDEAFDQNAAASPRATDAAAFSGLECCADERRVEGVPVTPASRMGAVIKLVAERVD